MKMGEIPAASLPQETMEGGQFLTFLLGEEIFGMDIRSVREVIQYAVATAVPLMPDFVCGVINLRGSVVPVIDLQRRFGRAAAQVGKKTCIVIFRTQQQDRLVELGLLVSAVSAVIDIQGKDIEPPPNFGATVRRDFIRGMGKVDNRFIVLLDPARALDVNEITRLCDAGVDDGRKAA